MLERLNQLVVNLKSRRLDRHASRLIAAIDKAFIEGPSVQIDPGLVSDVQEAVNELRKADPNFFRGVSKVVGYTGGEYGKVESTDPTIIDINLQKIKQKVQQDLGSSYQPSDPSYQQTFKEALKRSLVETLSHEKAHVRDWSEEKRKFPGGEGVAESAERAIIQKLHYDKPIEVSGVSFLLQQKIAILTQKVNPKTDRKEWVLVSLKDRKPLKYFGPTKPSKERVEKEERRIQYFKHQANLMKYLLKQAQDLESHQLADLLAKYSQIGVEDSSHPQGLIDYNLTGNDYWAGGANVVPMDTRLQALYKEPKPKTKPAKKQPPQDKKK